MVLQRTDRGKLTVLSSVKVARKGPLKLKVEAKGDSYQFSYSSHDGWKSMGEAVSGDILSTNVAGGFTGCLLGLYATSGNENISNGN